MHRGHVVHPQIQQVLACTCFAPSTIVNKPLVHDSFYQSRLGLVSFRTRWPIVFLKDNLKKVKELELHAENDPTSWPWNFRWNNNTYYTISCTPRHIDMTIVIAMTDQYWWVTDTVRDHGVQQCVCDTDGWRTRSWWMQDPQLWTHRGSRVYMVMMTVLFIWFGGCCVSEQEDKPCLEFIRMRVLLVRRWWKDDRLSCFSWGFLGNHLSLKVIRFTCVCRYHWWLYVSAGPNLRKPDADVKHAETLKSICLKAWHKFPRDGALTTWDSAQTWSRAVG